MDRYIKGYICNKTTEIREKNIGQVLEQILLLQVGPTKKKNTYLHLQLSYDHEIFFRIVQNLFSKIYFPSSII